MEHPGGITRKFMVVEDSPVFAALAASTIRFGFPNAQVTECHSFEAAVAALRSSDVDVLVCGYGVGEGKTVHDLRAICDVPIVVLTGRLHDVVPPIRSRVVEKSAGPVALQAALEGALTF